MATSGIRELNVDHVDCAMVLAFITNTAFFCAHVCTFSKSSPIALLFLLCCAVFACHLCRSSQPLLCFCTMPRAKPGFVHPLGWNPVVDLKNYPMHNANTNGFPPPSSQKAVSQYHLKNSCLTKWSVPIINGHSDRSL